MTKDMIVTVAVSALAVSAILIGAWVFYPSAKGDWHYYEKDASCIISLSGTVFEQQKRLAECSRYANEE